MARSEELTTSSGLMAVLLSTMAKPMACTALKDRNVSNLKCLLYDVYQERFAKSRSVRFETLCELIVIRP